MRRLLAERFTETHTDLGPWKRVGWREYLDTETGEITREGFAQHCLNGRWIEGLPPRKRQETRA